MTFLVDANVVFYSAVESGFRAPCLEIVRAVAGGEVEGRMSTAALEEVWHIELSGRAGDLAGLTRRAYAVFTPLLAVTDEIVQLALSFDAAPLGANDRIHAATCLNHGIETIVSADPGFDGFRGLRRVDPLDTRTLKRLLHP